jgi:hypothetical protein
MRGLALKRFGECLGTKGGIPFNSLPQPSENRKVDADTTSLTSVVKIKQKRKTPR